MAGNKKYYWLKLKEDFFDDDTIEWIEDQEGGERYSLFYLKLCLKSLKTDGLLIRNVGDLLIPYDLKKLSEITRTDIDTVRVAMDLFKKIGLIQFLDNGEIYLTQLENMVGSESKWAEKKRVQRAKTVESLPLPSESRTLSSKCPREIEIEKEKEIEIELTDRQRETVELVSDLFAGWQINENQIIFLSNIVNEQIPYDDALSLIDRELKIYDGLQFMTEKARAENVKHIYRWMLKVIPEVDIFKK